MTNETRSKNPTRAQDSKIKSTFNIDERPWRKEGKYILLCTQPKDNWSMAQKDPYVWVDEVVEQLKGVTDRPLMLRPHPNHADKCAEDIRKRHPQIKIADMTRGGGMFEGYRWTFLEELNKKSSLNLSHYVIYKTYLFHFNHKWKKIYIKLYLIIS